LNFTIKKYLLVDLTSLFTDLTRLQKKEGVRYFNDKALKVVEI